MILHETGGNSMELKEALEGDRRWLWSIVGTAEMEN
jgi:hypothetical protein